MTLQHALKVLRKQDPAAYKNALGAWNAIKRLQKQIRDEDPRDRASRTLEQILGIR